MAKRKWKQDRTIGKGKRNNPADSAGTDGAIEGQSTAENCTDRVSHGTLAAEQAKQKQIAATKEEETTLVVATPSTVACSQLAARSQLATLVVQLSWQHVPKLPCHLTLLPKHS